MDLFQIISSSFQALVPNLSGAYYHSADFDKLKDTGNFGYRDLDSIQFVRSPIIAAELNSTNFSVPRGQLTFDSEGLENPGGLFHSRRAHIPSHSSGITIGRGFDLGVRNGEEIRGTLSAVNFDPSFIERAVGGAGLRGRKAERYLRENPLPEISPAQQKALFTTVYAEMETDVRRIMAARNFATTKTYLWEEIPRAIQEVLVDLRFRGDYTAQTRSKIEPYLLRRDYAGFADLLRDSAYWQYERGVPELRVRARAEYLAQNQALETTFEE